jgi:hypothetical protein
MSETGPIGELWHAKIHPAKITPLCSRRRARLISFSAPDPDYLIPGYFPAP